MLTEAGIETAAPEEKKLKAGFIYVGPPGDFGWTYGHDRGRTIVDDKFDWLETVTAESVAPADTGDYIDSMFEDGADIVFTTSFGYLEPTVKKGEDWPNKMLYHCSGGPLPYEQITGEEFKSNNVGFYFADFYQIYYMNGLMAGALTETNKIGYVAAHTTSEVVRHLDAFMLGAKEVNPDIQMKVVETGEWYDPGASTTATETLISWGADSIAFTVDSPAVVQTCQSHYEETGERVYSFSHYSPMKSQGSDVVLSGQLVKWEQLYEDLLLKARSGVIENFQHWRLLQSGAVEMGSAWNEPINPEFVDDLQAETVTDPVFGEISVYELIMNRLEQFKQLRVNYHPFTGPIYDSEGNLKLKEGQILHQDNLRFGMDWYIEGTIPPE
ncbi:hypothetical protein AKJ39_00190 [candidate division MSBL1 archaeon SCGC-AAA259J03]|uniref:ABC transporter substrate-binding protein PnrA-like domain-containing protein n=2 Tax=candidate division MSBL1 TaxID=215777 RepID=A0A656YYJ0_9EURY|nr:hypothetical protein AKJ61_01120 [candidate division MSBL1 archaeon SCGC-AAA259B11]KXA98964.1 hypothetical protein AKJ39_00190 [candidate division MSBL1 archaeon SCGC-AAA259J03]